MKTKSRVHPLTFKIFLILHNSVNNLILILLNLIILLVSHTNNEKQIFCVEASTIRVKQSICLVYKKKSLTLPT